MKAFPGFKKFLQKYQLICTSENNLQHQHVTHRSRDGWRKRSIWHVWVIIHIWHHYVPRITRVRGSLVVKTSIWMLSWENPKNNQCCIDFLFMSLYFSYENLTVLWEISPYIKYLFTKYCNWIIMLYFRWTVFSLLSGLAANQMF